MEVTGTTWKNRRAYLKRMANWKLDASFSQSDADLEAEEVNYCSSPIRSESPDQLSCDLSTISGSSDDERWIFSESSDNDGSDISESEEEKLAKEDFVNSSGNVTFHGSLTLLAAISSKHHMTKAATGDMLKLLRLHLPNSSLIPKTNYMFEKMLKIDYSWINFHFVCLNCSTLLENFKCSECGKTYIEKDLRKAGTYFLAFDLRKQLECILKECRINVHLTKAFGILHLENSGVISDIRNGHAYKSIRFGTYDFSCTFNTDGVPVFKSSKFSIWPFLLSINELPYKIRKYVTILGGLWFGHSKPNIDLFLQPIVKTLNSFQQQPLSWSAFDGRKIVSKVHFIHATLDSPARCMLQGHTQYNGQFGCNWCEHPGKRIPVGRGHARVYPYSTADAPHRSDYTYREQVENEDFSRGVKRNAKLIKLKNFDMVHGFSVDYMHCVYLGIVRAMNKLWMEKVSAKYYIGRKASEMDIRLSGVLVPYEQTRTTRSITSRKYWKASEWRMWLFISPIILKGILDPVYLSNFEKLADAIFILSSTEIQESCLDKIQLQLTNYVANIETLFGEEHCTFNSHLLCHLVDCVRNWGPLFGSSAFQFESYNGKLLKYIKSSKGVDLQIAKKCLTEMQIRSQVQFSGETEREKLYFSCIKNSKSSVQFGLVRPRSVNFQRIKVKEQIKFVNRKVVAISESCSAYIHNYLFNSVTRNTTKRANSIVKLSDTQIGYIQTFYKITCKCNASCECNNLLVLVNSFTVKCSKTLSYCYYCNSNDPPCLEIVILENVLPYKFYTYENSGVLYFMQLPNLFEVDWNRVVNKNTS